MRILITSLAAGALLFSSALTGQAQSLWDFGEPAKNSLKEIKPEEFTAPNYKPGVVRHIVLLRYKPEVSDAQRIAILERFRNLKNTSLRNGHPYIVAIHAGPQHSHEGIDQGFDQVFILKFRSEGDRNYYVGPPVITNPAFYDAERLKFKEVIDPLLAEHGVLVFDFTSEK